MPFPQSTIHNNPRVSFLLRTVITTGYVHSGYQNSSPWKNVNRYLHSNDTPVSLGDVLTAATGYPGGFANDNVAWITKANNGVGGSDPAVMQFNMRTEVGSTAASAPVSLGNSGVFMQKEQQFAYGNANVSTTIVKFNMINATWQTSLSNAYSNTTGGSGGSSFYHEYVGYTWADNNIGMKFVFATETQSQSSVCGYWGQQKGISSKLNYLYAGNEGGYNGGYYLRRWSVATETNVGNVSKPIGNCGEENFDMGQDHQYCMGNYDGSQNRRAWSYSYITDSGYEGGSSMQPQGPAGRSSAYNSQRS